jgi:hypothetical protein
MMKTTFAAISVAMVLAAPAVSAPLDLPGLLRTGTVSNGSGGIFYATATGALTDDFPFDPLVFDAGLSGGDFAGVNDTILDYDFLSGSGLFIVDPGGPQDAGFEITDAGFSGDTIEFLLAYDAASLGPAPYPGAVGAVLSITSADFSSAPVPLDSVGALEDFFVQNSDPFGEFLAPVSFSIQALAPVPAPAPLLLLGTALAGLGLARRKRAAVAS